MAKKTYRVSIKGVVPSRGRILLMHKPNRTWDLPGGRLETGERMEDCLVREIFEETGLRVRTIGILGSWVRQRRGKPDVFTVAYLCRPARAVSAARVAVSDEHIGAELFAPDEVAHLRMVEGCRRTVLAAFDAIPRR